MKKIFFFVLFLFFSFQVFGNDFPAVVKDRHSFNNKLITVTGTVSAIEFIEKPDFKLVEFRLNNESHFMHVNLGLFNKKAGINNHFNCKEWDLLTITGVFTASGHTGFLGKIKSREKIKINCLPPADKSYSDKGISYIDGMRLEREKAKKLEQTARDEGRTKRLAEEELKRKKWDDDKLAKLQAREVVKAELASKRKQEAIKRSEAKDARIKKNLIKEAEFKSKMEVINSKKAERERVLEEQKFALDKENKRQQSLEVHSMSLEGLSLERKKYEGLKIKTMAFISERNPKRVMITKDGFRAMVALNSVTFPCSSERAVELQGIYKPSYGSKFLGRLTLVQGESPKCLDMQELLNQEKSRIQNSKKPSDEIKKLKDAKEKRIQEVLDATLN